MTALDERAEFVAMKLGFSDDKDPEAFSAAISELLWMQREALNAALEQAADIADQHASIEGIAQKIATEIRALKEPA